MNPLQVGPRSLYTQQQGHKNNSLNLWIKVNNGIYNTRCPNKASYINT